MKIRNADDIGSVIKKFMCFSAQKTEKDINGQNVYSEYIIFII